MSKNFPLPLVQEVRNLVALLCREACMKDKASGETVDGQKILHEKCFHGDASRVSLLDKVCSGKGDFASMYAKIPIENNREGNDERSDSYMLQLLDIFSCDIGKIFVHD
jgi:hypothetical protein